MTRIWSKLLIKLGYLCPEHQEKPYWDDEYGKLRCSVTDEPMAYEHRE